MDLSESTEGLGIKRGSRRLSASEIGPSDFTLKVLVVGDSGVGKTALLARFCTGKFTASYISTIGIDFRVTTLPINGKMVKLQVWDTAGQERFKTLTSAFFRGAQGVLLVYDVTNMASFLNVKNWISHIRKHNTDEIQYLVVGNKCDLNEQRVVSPEAGQELAEQYGMDFLETSAFNNTNVHSTFLSLAKNVIDHMKSKSPGPPRTIPDVNLNQPSSGWGWNCQC